MVIKRIAAGIMTAVMAFSIAAAPAGDIRAAVSSGVTASAEEKLGRNDVNCTLYIIDNEGTKTEKCHFEGSLNGEEGSTDVNVKLVDLDGGNIKTFGIDFFVPDLPADKQMKFRLESFITLEGDVEPTKLRRFPTVEINSDKPVQTEEFDLTKYDMASYSKIHVVLYYKNFEISEYPEVIPEPVPEPVPEKKSLSNATLTLARKKAVYTGKALKPAVTVTLDGKTLKSGTDYTVAYKNNVNCGKATVTVTGKGSYEGSKSGSFIIKPAKMTAKKLTSPKAKTIKLTWKKAKGGVTGYKVQVALDKKFKKSAKTYTVKKAAATSKTIKKLKSKKTYFVRVSAYKKVGKTSYTGGWSKVKKVKCK